MLISKTQIFTRYVLLLGPPLLLPSLSQPIPCKVRLLRLSSPTPMMPPTVALSLSRSRPACASSRRSAPWRLHTTPPPPVRRRRACLRRAWRLQRCEAERAGSRASCGCGAPRQQTLSLSYHGNRRQMTPSPQPHWLSSISIPCLTPPRAWMAVPSVTQHPSRVSCLSSPSSRALLY